MSPPQRQCLPPHRASTTRPWCRPNTPTCPPAAARHDCAEPRTARSPIPVPPPAQNAAGGVALKLIGHLGTAVATIGGGQHNFVFTGVGTGSKPNRAPTQLTAQLPRLLVQSVIQGGVEFDVTGYCNRRCCGTQINKAWHFLGRLYR